METENEMIYMVFKDSTIFGVYDQEKWDEFNGHYKEKNIINRFNVYKSIINKKPVKIYWNRYTDLWEIDK